MVSLDRVFDLLSEERRRYALYYLEEADGSVSIDELAEQIAQREVETERESTPPEKFEQIEMELFHQDLPKAADTEYIRYNPEEGTVELTNAPSEVRAILTVAKVIERPNRSA